jgi:hypothetical protein
VILITTTSLIYVTALVYISMKIIGFRAVGPFNFNRVQEKGTLLTVAHLEWRFLHE